MAMPVTAAETKIDGAGMEDAEGVSASSGSGRLKAASSSPSATDGATTS